MYSPESSVRKTGSYIYEEFMPTDGTDVKVQITDVFQTAHVPTFTVTCCQLYSVGIG